MKEELFTYEEHFVNGLRRDAREKINAPFLDACYNLKPSPYGLVEVHVPVLADSDSYVHSVDTRILVGESQVIVMDTDGTPDIQAFVMDLSDRSLGSDLLTSGQINDATDDGAVGVSGQNLTVGNNYQFVEVDGVWFITNGVSFLTNIDLYTAEWNGAIQANSALPKGVCLYNDRFVMCGLENSNATGADKAFAGNTNNPLQTLWTNVWEAQRTFAESRGINSDDDIMNGSYVVTGTPSGGSSDVPFDLEMMLVAGYKSARHMEVVDAASDGQILFTKIPWKGDALGVSQLGDNLIIYGDYGVGIMRPIRGDSTSGQIPVEYFEIEQILDVGIINAVAHVGDRLQQTFIDSRGDVYRITADLKLTKLGYREFIKPLVDADINMSFDPREGDVYISDEVNGFLLTPTGMCTPRFILNGILPYSDGVLYGTWTVDSGNTSTFKTHPTNMDSSAFKFMQYLSFDQEGPFTAPTAHMDYKIGYAGSWITNTLLALNVDGDVYPGQQGTEFKLSWASGAVAVDSRISRVRARFKRTDKRRRRNY